MVYGLFRTLPGVPGLLATVIRELLRELDTSVGVPGPHGFAVRRPASFVKEAARVHRIPSRVRNVRETPLLPERNGVLKSLIWG